MTEEFTVVQPQLTVSRNLGNGNFVGNDESQASRGYGADLKKKRKFRAHHFLTSLPLLQVLRSIHTFSAAVEKDQKDRDQNFKTIFLKKDHRHE